MLGDIRNLVGPYARAFGRSGTQAGWRNRLSPPEARMPEQFKIWSTRAGHGKWISADVSFGRAARP